MSRGTSALGVAVRGLAMLRQGECFEAQDQPENARLFYEDVVRLWPKSKAAKEARKKM